MTAERVATAPPAWPLRTAVEVAGETLAALGRGFVVERRRASADASAVEQAAAPAGPGFSRRDLFSFLARGARRATAEGLAPSRRTVGDLHGQARPPAAQTRLLDDLDALGSAGESRAAAVPAALPVALPLATLVAGASCNGCGLCARYCPHGALTFAEGVLTCDRSRCTACGLCVEACPPAALEQRPATAPCGPGRADLRSVVRLWPAVS